jgi:hypothetical protein
MNFSTIKQLTKADLEGIDRLDHAVRAVVAVVFPDDKAAAYGLLGCALYACFEAGLSGQNVADMIELWSRKFEDTQERVTQRSKEIGAVGSPIRCPRCGQIRSRSC